MRPILFVVFTAVLGACDSGPTEAELADKRAEKSCSKLYSSLTKVLTDELHKGGVADVEFGEKQGFIERCTKAGFTEEQIKCMDPNLGGTEECKKALEPVADKTKKVQEYLLAPMRKAAEERAGKAGKSKGKAP